MIVQLLVLAENFLAPELKPLVLFNIPANISNYIRLRLHHGPFFDMIPPLLPNVTTFTQESTLNFLTLFIELHTPQQKTSTYVHSNHNYLNKLTCPCNVNDHHATAYKFVIIAL